jgi:hypothetical protein
MSAVGVSSRGVLCRLCAGSRGTEALPRLCRKAYEAPTSTLASAPASPLRYTLAGVFCAPRRRPVEARVGACRGCPERGEGLTRGEGERP